MSENIVYGFGWIGALKDNNTILLNENLKNYLVLQQQVIEHELGHKDNNFLQDLWHDIVSFKDVDFQLNICKFQLVHPLSLLPFIIVKENKLDGVWTNVYFLFYPLLFWFLFFYILFFH